jgi:two-component system cell cycle response regulator
MPVLLCIDASPSTRLQISQLANEAGIGVRFCDNEKEGIDCLNDGQPYALVVVGDNIEVGGSIRLVQDARMHVARAVVPVAFLLTDHDLDLARRAMGAGATEIFLRTDSAAISGFISECVLTSRKISLSGRVLLVEDSASQAAYTGNLCRTLGLTVDLCASVEEGIELFQRNDYQLAVIDIVLLGMQSGLALVRHIRQSSSPCSNLPILVMSGYDDVARRIEALRSGADDFLNKPFVDEELVWRLHRVMQWRVADDLGMDGVSAANSTWLQRGLSARESDVCEALMRGAPDKEIAELLGISYWTVRTHIRNIFTKLGVLNRRELMARFLAKNGQ